MNTRGKGKGKGKAKAAPELEGAEKADLLAMLAESQAQAKEMAKKAAAAERAIAGLKKQRDDALVKAGEAVPMDAEGSGAGG